MEKENKQPKSKFNIYWVYGLVVFILLGMSFFGGDNKWQNLKKINISNFESYLNAGDISEVIIIRNESSVQVSIKPDALSKAEHQAITGKNILGQDNVRGPHYQFEIGSLERFEDTLEEAKKNGIEFRLDYITTESRWLDVLISFLPIIIIGFFKCDECQVQEEGVPGVKFIILVNPKQNYLTKIPMSRSPLKTLPDWKGLKKRYKKL